MALTPKEKNDARRERLEALGLKQLGKLYAHPDDHKQIAAFVEKLNEKRGIEIPDLRTRQAPAKAPAKRKANTRRKAL